jgi:hypothetical protein
LDPKTILTHVSGGDHIYHVLKKIPHDAKGWVGTIIACLSNVFHVLDVNINFALFQEVDVKANQIINAFYPPV